MTAAQDELLTRVLATAGAYDDATSERILDATYELLQTFGLRRTTMDDVARRARLGRATVYRRFPQKSDLVDAVVLRECRRLIEEIEHAVSALPTVEERIVEGYVVTLRHIRSHPLIDQLMRIEPEVTLPYLTTHGEPVIAMCRGFVANHLLQAESDRRLSSAEADLIAEIFVRLVHSLLLTPGGMIPVDESEAREFARHFLAAPLRH